MSVSRPVEMLHRIVASVSIVGMLSSSLLAQTGQPVAAAVPNAPQAQAEYSAPMKQYTQPYSVLSGFKPYRPHGLPEPVLQNSDRLHQLTEGRQADAFLERRAVALALENNFDIAIARYNLDIATRTFCWPRAARNGARHIDRIVDWHAGWQRGLDKYGWVHGQWLGGTSTGTGGSASARAGL